MSKTSAVDRLRATLFPPGRPGVKNFKFDAGPRATPETVAQSVLDALDEIATREAGDGHL